MRCGAGCAGSVGASYAPRCRYCRRRGMRRPRRVRAERNRAGAGPDRRADGDAARPGAHAGLDARGRRGPAEFALT